VPNRASAAESISPALARTKQLLFRPFRFGLWARLAVVALITGEAGGGGGGGGSIPNFNPNRGQGGDNHWAKAAHLFSEPSWEQIQPYMGWIVVGVVLALAVMLLWIYSDCVYRFILLDAVVSGQCRLREGWRRWRAAARRYFLWVITFGFGAFAVVGLVVGVPVLLAYRAGRFEHPDQNLGVLIGGGILLALVVIVLVAVLAIIDNAGAGFSSAGDGIRECGRTGRLGTAVGDNGHGEAGLRRVCVDEDRASSGRRNYFYDSQFDCDFGVADSSWVAGPGRVPHRQRLRDYVGHLDGTTGGSGRIVGDRRDSLRCRVCVCAGTGVLPIVHGGVFRAALRTAGEQDASAKLAGNAGFHAARADIATT
jgi:hypothetical protein